MDAKMKEKDKKKKGDKPAPFMKKGEKGEDKAEMMKGKKKKKGGRSRNMGRA